MSCTSLKSSSVRKSQLILFERLRALAIIIILFHHLPAHSVDFYQVSFLGVHYNLHWLNHLNRYLALSLFTFMSGYLLEYNYPVIENRVQIWNFLIKRYLRVYPLYILAMLTYFKIFPQFININPCTVLTNCLGLQMIFARENCMAVMTLWFIGLMLTYYVIFVLMKLLVSGTKSLIIFIGSLVAGIISAKILFGIGDKRLLMYLPIFLSGAYSCKWKILEKMSARWVVFLSIFLILFIWLYFRYSYPKIYLSGAKPQLFSLVSAQAFVLVDVIMLCFAYWTVALFKNFESKKFHKITYFISYASYSVYLVHRPIWWLMAKAYDSPKKILMLAYMMGLGIPLVIFVGYCVQLTYDRYIFIPLSRKLFH